MSDATRRAQAQARDRIERPQRRIALLLTVLVHALLLLLIWLSPAIRMSPPQGGSAGSAGAAGDALEVTYVDLTVPPAPAAPKPPARKMVTSKPKKVPPPAVRVQPKPVEQSRNPVPPAEPETTVAEVAEPEEVQPPVSAPLRTPRPGHVTGQPPGMRAQAVTPGDDGSAQSPIGNRGRGSSPGSGASMEVGGYQVYYEPMYEARLRELRAQGVTELYLPLPGTRRLMVCPIEIIVRHGSGACRMVEQDSPELASIADARQVILMQRIYKQGEEVWSGPGPYR